LDARYKTLFEIPSESMQNIFLKKIKEKFGVIILIALSLHPITKKVL